WVHDNVEADEVLFYVRGNFGSRRGIESGAITLHPRGIPHGPHPGTIMASRNATRTEELAVMFDTQHTLELTEESLRLTIRNIRKAGWTEVDRVLRRRDEKLSLVNAMLILNTTQ